MGGSSLNPLSLASDAWAGIKDVGNDIDKFTDDIDGTTARRAQEKAMKEARQAAKRQASLADQAMNRANQKTPNIAAILASNKRSAASGNSSTLLTGPSGVSPGTVPLGRNTLLGQ